MNIIEYLEKKRQKYNYNIENNKYYYNYIYNLSRFNKMIEYKIYFITELLLIDNKEKEKRNIKKLRRILKNNKSEDIYFSFVKIKYLYKRKEYKEALEVINKIKTNFILFDSFLSEIKYMEITCCNELNIKISSNNIIVPWNGIYLLFESELEKELFNNNKPLKGTSYERIINIKVNKINLLFKKSNKIINQFFINKSYKNIKELINNSFGWKEINNSINELKEFLDKNLALTNEFMEFYIGITNIYIEIQNYLMIQNIPFKEINYQKIIPEININKLLERLGKNNKLNLNEFQIHLKLIISEKIKNQKCVIPLIPEFYDLAYDYINEFPSTEINEIEDNLDALEITGQ